MFPNCVLLSILSFRMTTALVKLQNPPPRPLQCQGNESVSEQLVADLFFQSNTSAVWQRPRINGSEPVVVNITFVLSSIMDVQERQRLLRLNGYLSIVLTKFSFYLRMVRGLIEFCFI